MNKLTRVNDRLSVDLDYVVAVVARTIAGGGYYVYLSGIAQPVEVGQVTGNDLLAMMAAATNESEDGNDND